MIGTSPGAIGTAVAQQHLRSVLSYCNSPQMNSPEAYIQFKDGMINDAGESDRRFHGKVPGQLPSSEFHVFIARVLAVLPRGA